MTCCVLVLVSCYLCDTVSIKYYLTTAAQSPRLIITVWPGDSCQKVEMKCECSGDVTMLHIQFYYEIFEGSSTAPAIVRA